MARKLFSFCLLVLLAFPAEAFPAAAPFDFTALVATAGPAVVNINTEKMVQARQMPTFPFPSPFDDFFRDDRFGGQNAPQRKQRSLGSGFLISSDGYIVTNFHVINGADAIQVSLSGELTGGKDVKYKAELIGSDKETDLALLKIKADKNLPFLKFGDSGAMKVGEWVIAIGNPFGLDHSVTAGILSAKGRNIRSGPFDSFLQTDASINPGNSGGPLLNLAGEVIGVNTMILANGQGIGFAIPSSMAKDIVDDLRSNKKVSRGWLGVTIQNVDEKSAKALGLPAAEGALIGDVLPGNPAAKAGIRPGDVITALNGEKVRSSDDLLRKVAAIKPGGKALLSIWRSGATKEISVVVAERGTETEAGGKGSEAQSLAMLGIRVRPVSPDEAARLRLDAARGMLVLEVENGKAADDAGMRPGDVILGVNGTPVNTEKELEDIVAAQGKQRGAIMLHLSRQGQKFLRALEVRK